MKRISMLLCVIFSFDAAAARMSIMTFNVENLFDTEHDEGKEDYTYLPLSRKNSPRHRRYCNTLKQKKWKDECLHLDWNETSLDRKMERLANSVLQVQDGRGPDVLILQEVENRRVLEKWLQGPLANAKYLAPILIEGSDSRGIDVAVLTRLPLKAPARLHDLGLMRDSKKVDARGILEVELGLPDGRTLTVYAVHFPMPAHPPQWREKSFESLTRLMKKKGKDALVVAGGDFNVPARENAERKTLQRWVKPDWVVVHEIQCQECKGTIYYPPKKEWSFFDMLLLKEGGGWRLDSSKSRVVNSYSEQRKSDGTPKRFNSKTGSGVSDHWPFYTELMRHE